MKKVTLTILTGIMILTSVNAMAIVLRPGEERAIRRAQMEKIEASGEFIFAESVSLTLTKKDDAKRATGLYLNYLNTSTGEIRTVHLPIIQKRDLGCGSAEYLAELPLPNEDRDRRVGLPFYGKSTISISLTDHSGRFCRDLPENIWEATVSENIGCLVSHMTLEGHPEIIYTIQRLEE